VGLQLPVLQQIMKEMCVISAAAFTSPNWLWIEAERKVVVRQHAAVVPCH
jgi:hypothetical protein